MTDETTDTSTGTSTGTGSTATEETTWLGPAYTGPEEDGSRSGFHPLQTGYLVAGLLALGVALMWLLTERDVMEIGDGGVAFSVVLITAGAAGLLASLGRALRRR